MATERSDDGTSTTKAYVPPTVWVDDSDPTGSQFSSMNKPTAGARMEKELPVGKHPIQLYSLGTPNGQKVTILLEELLALGKTDCEYDAWLIDIMKGDQFGSDFVSINPNSKIPAMRIYRGSPLEDSTEEEPLTLFESGSMLLHLAETYGAGTSFLPSDPKKKTMTMNWLFWQMASAPYVGGGFGHFFAYARDKQKYPIDRFTMETKRQLDVLNKQLANNTYMIGSDYTIADMAIFPWYGLLVLGSLYTGSAVFLNVEEEYPHVIRWAKLIDSRPAVKRGKIVNKPWGDERLLERHDASDFIDKVVVVNKP